MGSDDNHTILVVDDEEPILKLVERQLSGLPYTVIPTASSAEAIHLLETREFALLICDLNMPQIDGNVVLSTAREKNPNITSILITGGTDHSATIKAINEGGIWKYLAKPWHTAEFVELVRDGVTRYATLCHQQAQLVDLARDLHTREQTSGPTVTTAPPAQKTPDRKSRHMPRIRVLGPPSDASAAGKTIQQLVGNRYEIMGMLGKGGMGSVYKAEDLLLDMPVAIKILQQQLTDNETALSTLREEARIAMQLSHRHIVRLHNLQESQGNYFLVMEYVPGRTFRDILNVCRKLPLDTVMQIVRVVSDALSYAHRHGVLHKDLKPGNLLLGHDGVLKVIDFGLAALVGSRDNSIFVGGTPVYMSPEQIRAETLDARSDVYSLGVIIYELLTGAPPFPLETTDLELLAIGPKELPGLPEEMTPVIKQALAPDRRDRWESVADFSSAIVNAPAKLFV